MQKDEALKILSLCPDSEAFHFYKDIGSPIGESARSLDEFISLIKTVETSSLEFHSQRGDFKNWVKMLGDEVLVKQVGNIQKSEYKGGVLRKRLLQVLHLRYGFLRKIAEA